MIKTGTLALLLLCAHTLPAQSIKAFEPLLAAYPPGSRLNANNLQRIPEPPSFIFDTAYLIPYNGDKTLYNRPIEKITLGIKNDTILSITISVPFDTALHKEMDRELGAPDFGWMGFALGSDTTGVIWNRYWDLPAYTVSFKCTRYQYRIGEVKQDLIEVSLLQKRKPLP